MILVLTYYLFWQCNTPELCLELLAEAAIEVTGGLPYGAKVALGLFGSAMVLAVGGGGAYLTYKIIQCRRDPTPTPTDAEAPPQVGGPPPPPETAAEEDDDDNDSQGLLRDEEDDNDEDEDDGIDDDEEDDNDEDEEDDRIDDDEDDNNEDDNLEEDLGDGGEERGFFGGFF